MEVELITTLLLVHLQRNEHSIASTRAWSTSAFCEYFVSSANWLSRLSGTGDRKSKRWNMYWSGVTSGLTSARRKHPAPRSLSLCLPGLFRLPQFHYNITENVAWLSTPVSVNQMAKHELQTWSSRRSWLILNTCPVNKTQNRDDKSLQKFPNQRCPLSTYPSKASLFLFIPLQ